MTARLMIVFALYPGVTHLDFTGPHQVLCNLPGATAIGASLSGGSIEAQGLVFGDLARLSDIEACDVLCVPGGFGCTDVMADPAFLEQIRRLARGARYVTSVCTGSLILAAAGLLQGRRAACHWAWRDLLALFGAIPDDAGRPETAPTAIIELVKSRRGPQMEERRDAIERVARSFRPDDAA